MSSYNNTSNSVNFSSYNYTTLRNYNEYNNPTKHNVHYMEQPPVVPISGKYVVPVYKPITYDALTGGSDPDCNDYFNITKAYGSDVEDENESLNPFKCETKFGERICNSKVKENYRN
jgi:hypothetical protein